MFRTTGVLVAAALGASVVTTPSSASAASDRKCYGTQAKEMWPTARAIQDSVEPADR
ncbi:hypothetical protein [Streptosporangium sp. KLBMP 9127]|nr:hypothetical protein [Streptosporangium sp. KLBMP 9127]